MKARVLFQYGRDGRPHGSAYIRLIRPLTHPRIARGISVEFARRNEGDRADVVLVDRLWRPDLSVNVARDLVVGTRMTGAKLIVCLDDNFHDLPQAGDNSPTAEHLQALDLLLENASGVIVTTHALGDRLKEKTRQVVIVPNALDERLVAAPPAPARAASTSEAVGQLTIGYMGTYTHDDDLRIILPALQRLKARAGRQIVFELIGGSQAADVSAALEQLGAIRLAPPHTDDEYPAFMLWFTGRVRWDIGLAPLGDSAFNECKSDLKLLDYAAVGAATIFSKSRAFGTVRSGETGLFADNDPDAWFGALDNLVRDGALRTSVARAASEYLRNDRLLSTSPEPTIAQAIQEIV